METGFDHNKLLKSIAKKRLTPFGITQQGKSRTFLYDYGWWTIIIEFQPSSYSKGSFLNIGLDFNFYPRNYFAFSVGYREKEFEEAKDDAQFAKIVNDYCDLIVRKVDNLKLNFEDVWTATNTFKKQADKGAWYKFDLAILYGLTGNLSSAKMYLEIVKAENCERDFEFERQRLIAQIIPWLENDQTFLTKMKDLINYTRGLKKLSIVDLDSLGERKKSAGSGVIDIGDNATTLSAWNFIKHWFWRLTNKGPF